MIAFLAIAGTDVRDSDVDDDLRHPNTSNCFYNEGINGFGTLPTGRDALQVPNDDILGRPPDVLQHVANGRPPISSTPDEFEENLPPLPPPLTMQNAGYGNTNNNKP
jgi:hypothetical protein